MTNVQTESIESTKSCSREDIAAYIDGDMSPSAEIILEAHVSHCRNCLAELNLQKRMFGALDGVFDDEAEIELPENFAKIVAVRAESDVKGLRSNKERFRALFLSALLMLIILLGLGAETGNVLAMTAKFGEQWLAVAHFAGHLIYDLAIGTTIILRSLSGQFVGGSALPIVMCAVVFAVSALTLSQMIVRRSRS